MMRGMIRGILKMLAVPGILLSATAAFIVKTATNLSCYIMGPLMLFILGCGIYSAVQRMWSSVLILVVMEVFCMAVLFLAAEVLLKLEDLRDFLIGYLHS